MKRGALFAILSSLASSVFAFTATTAFAQVEPDAKTITVTRIISSIPALHKWGDLQSGWSCGAHTPLLWGRMPGAVAESGLQRAARAELKREGFAIANDPDDPFGKTVDANLVLGGTLTAISGTFCGEVKNGQPWIKGSATLEIDWQVYSSIDRQVVAKGHASGSGQLDAFDEDGFTKILRAAVSESVSGFTRSDAFAALTTRTAGSGEVVLRPTRPPLALAGAGSARGVKISDAVGSVVLILSAAGHGSGFLVSTDGYLMTAEHVVGSDKYVKIRWSDGLEGLGEVIRADKRRDVALIKTDPRGRQPLALRRTAPEPGDTVFAIGAPIDPKLQNTVTRGVASANRIMDGFSFIQSDVTVDPGNSGGPLLDEQGRVLGFTDIGIRTKDAPTGLNFFVPIDDALRFLAAEPQ